MPDICSWGTNYTFLQEPPSKVCITIWVPKWGQFWGFNSISRTPKTISSGCMDMGPEMEMEMELTPQWLAQVGQRWSWRWIWRWSCPSPDPYLCCTFWGSTPSLAPVPYMSQLRWWGVNFISGSISSSVYLNIISLHLHKPYFFTFQVQFW